MKESIGKLLGFGLIGNLKEGYTEIIDDKRVKFNNERVLYYKIFSFDSYIICATSKKEIKVNEYNKLDVKNMISQLGEGNG